MSRSSEPDMHKPLGDLDRLKAVLEKDWGWKDLLVAPHVIPLRSHADKLPDQPRASNGASPRRSIATWIPRGPSSSASIPA